MHGIRTSPHHSIFKSTKHNGLNGDPLNEGDVNSERPEPYAKRVKPTSGRAKADVEKQILDWQEEMKD